MTICLKRELHLRSARFFYIIRQRHRRKPFTAGVRDYGEIHAGTNS